MLNEIKEDSVMNRPSLYEIRCMIDRALQVQVTCSGTGHVLGADNVNKE